MIGRLRLLANDMTPEERSILHAVFQASNVFDGGALRKTFRAAHFGRLDILDGLVKAGDVREYRDRYMVELLTLAQLDEPWANGLVADCREVFDVLLKRYIEAQDELIVLDSLIARSHLPPDRFRRALAYLNTFHGVIGGQVGQSYDEPAIQVAPSEMVLNSPSFDHVLGLLRSYREARNGMSAPYEFSPLSMGAPKVEVTQPPGWLKELPMLLADLLAEVLEADKAGLQRLTAMGIRAAIDAWADDVVGKDLRSFVAKLDELQTRNCITPSQREHLDAVVQVGHASSHRGFAPKQEDIADCLGILERALKAHYVDPKAAQRLKAGTPARTK